MTWWCCVCGRVVVLGNGKCASRNSWEVVQFILMNWAISAAVGELFPGEPVTGGNKILGPFGA